MNKTDRPLGIGLIYSAFVLVLLPLNYIIWLTPGAEGFMPADGRRRLYRYVCIGAALMVCLAVTLLAGRLAPRTSDRLRSRLRIYLTERRYLISIVVLILAFIWPLFTAGVVLDGFMSSGDEFAYVFQARGLAEGHLWYEPPPLGNAFVAWRTWVSGDKWVSQYPPGWPLFLAGGQLAGVPLWAVNSVYGGVLAALLLATVWRWVSPQAAIVATAVFVSTSFYLFNAGSYHSHIITALCLLLLVILAKRAVDANNGRAAFLSGLLLGVIGITRYLPMLLVLPALLADTLRSRKLFSRNTVFVILGGVPLLAFLLYYHYAITGNPLKSTYSVIEFDSEIWLTFNLQTLSQGWRIFRSGLLSLAEWTCPLLLLFYMACLIFKIYSRSWRFFDLVFPAFWIGYLFFLSLGGIGYGPRYYFDAYPLMLLTIATAYDSVAAFIKRFCKEYFLMHGFAACLIYCVLSYIFIALRYDAIVWERQEVYRLAQSAQLKNAVVIINSSTGGIIPMQPYELARNEPGLQGNVLFANGNRADSDLIRNLFPDRSLWIYERDQESLQGKLRLAD